MSYTTENNFVIAEGEAGDLYFFISAKNAHPQSPRIVYDGKEHAVFWRSSAQHIILDYINPEIREKLRKSHEVIVVETLCDNIKESYYVPMQIVDDIPVDWSKMGLSSWEEQALKAH